MLRPLLHCCIVALLHYCIVALLHYFIATLLHYFIDALPHCHHCHFVKNSTLAKYLTPYNEFIKQISVF